LAVTLPIASSFVAGQWGPLVAEVATGNHNDTIESTSPSTMYGTPRFLRRSGEILLATGMGAQAISDGTNWFVTEWGTLPSQNTFSGASYQPDVYDCYHRIDKGYACFVTWATMAMALIPAIARVSHDALGWPAASHPFLDYIEDGYLAAALLLGGAMVAYEIVNGSLPRAVFTGTFALGVMTGFWAGLWVFAILLLNHWLVAIGLASAVHSRWEMHRFALAAATLSLVGEVLFARLFSRPDLMLRLTTWALRFRFGFVHYLYDRWIYKFSDPPVGATIDATLFA
jgi:hypothetical protein